MEARHYPDAAAVSERLAAIAAARRVKSYLVCVAGVDGTGKVTLAWSFDHATLDAEAKTGGRSRCPRGNATCRRAV